jgi:hypothetical protein
MDAEAFKLIAAFLVTGVAISTAWLALWWQERQS